MSVVKQEQFNRGIRLSSRWLEINGFDSVQVNNLDDGSHRSSQYLKYIRTCGFYSGRDQLIWISPKRCAVTAGPKMSCSWSFPRFKIDRTPIGVVAHEVGHYVDHKMGRPSARLEKAFLAKKGAVSGYEPNNSESFAESMRLFILNPDLLKQANPIRYEFLRKELGLRPLTKKNWEEVLEKEGAHERIVNAARNWIDRLNS